MNNKPARKSAPLKEARPVATPKPWTAASIQFLAQPELRKLLEVIRTKSKRDYVIVLIAYRRGLRASEVDMLQCSDFDEKQYRLRITRLKNSLAGVHPLQPDEVKALKAYLRTRNTDTPALSCRTATSLSIASCSTSS